MHRKIFPNKNRKMRLLENQLQQKLKNPNSGYGKNRFSNDKSTGVDAPQNFSKQKSQDASIGKSIAAKTQKSKFRIWKNRFGNDKTTKTTKSRCTAKFFQTKIARRVYWKINSSKNSKIQTPDMAKISLPRGCNGKTPKNPTKKTRSISPFTIVIKGVREFFREKFHDKPPTPEAELVTKNPSRRKAKTVELCKTAKTEGKSPKKLSEKNDSTSPYYVNNCSQGEGGWGERLILGAPRECRVILGTALGIRHPCVQLSNGAPRAS